MPKRKPNHKAEDPEAGVPKKRRIISWDPGKGAQSVSSAPALKKRKLSNLWKTIGAAACIFVIWLGWRIWVVVLSPEAITGSNIASGDAGAPGSGAQTGSYQFVSRTRVERRKSEALQSLTNVRNISDNHPALLQAMVDIERVYEVGVIKISAGAYSEAMTKFSNVMEMVANFRGLVDQKGNTQKTYDNFLDLLEPMEKARPFAPYDFEIALAKGNSGRLSLDNGRFGDANRSFKEAIEILNDLQSRVDTLLAEQELRGKQALNQGDKDAAIKHFTDILEFKPDYKFALDGLMRAETIDQVYTLLQSARDREADGDLNGALADFQRAFQLDPLSARAQQGQSRVAAIIKQNRYDSLMSAASAAAEAGNWDDAVNNYETALKEFPEHQEIPDLLAEARESRWQAMLLAALNKARNFERQYLWVKARDGYLEVLEMENQHEEALAGLLRAGKNIRFLNRYYKLVEIASEKTIRGDFQQAIRDFNDAMATKPSYLQLDEKTRALQNILSIQSQPVDIQFISDGKTWVSIAGYKRPEKYVNFSAKILPGNYLIKGSRKGYRDVIYRLAVRQGQIIEPITVICAARY